MGSTWSEKPKKNEEPYEMYKAFLRKLKKQ